jgi:BirA family transcriptional regulator, biotin operon repressor / biotin---[acetyl-CoA-carboxylase] ligase
VTRYGRPRRHLREAGSTNDVARELVERGAPSGAIVTAARQTAGRGRLGRAWSAPDSKALLLSAIARDLDLEQALLPLAVPIAVCEAIESLAPVEARIKWPNDVWLDERKVAGVLIEARPPDWALLGIGVNVALEPSDLPADLRWPAASLGGEVSVAEARRALCAALDRTVEEPAEKTLTEFRRRDALAGREVSWEGAGVAPGSGTAVGVADDGNLIVELAGGETLALGSGEVSLRLG